MEHKKMTTDTPIICHHCNSMDITPLPTALRESMIKADNYSQELARTQKNLRAVSMERDSLREKSQKLEAERDEARKALILNLQTTGGMPWREWSAECAKETCRADANLERAEKAETEVERLRNELAKGAKVLSTIVTALEDAVPWIRETLNRD